MGRINFEATGITEETLRTPRESSIKNSSLNRMIFNQFNYQLSNDYYKRNLYIKRTLKLKFVKMKIKKKSTILKEFRGNFNN